MIEKGYRDCRRNKALIATVSFCMMAYTRNKYTNLLQMVTGYFSFAHNVSKRRTEVYHKMGLVVSYKTIWQALNANRQAVLRLLCERVNVERFFLSYNNINFYKKVQDQRVHNKNHQVAYTAGYIYFIKGEASLLCHTVDYEAVNKLTLSNFLLAAAKFQHQTEATRYILS